MKAAKIAGIVAVSCALPGAYGLFRWTKCVPLNDSAKARLINYVRKKYNVPSDAALRVSDASQVGATCYRKLEFKSEGTSRPFRISLFATPDLKYLTKELLDTGTSATVGTPSPQTVTDVATGDFPVLGPSNAPVTVAVFSDFECPYCARFAAMMRKEVLPAEGQHVRLVFRQFPLKMHPWARAAAEASACAYRQKNDYFWNFHDYFFDHQSDFTPGNLTAKVLEHASTVSGLDRAKFQACLSKSETAPVIEREVAFGNDNGIHGTPTVFINGRQARAGDAAQMLSLVRQIEKDPQTPMPSPEAATVRNKRPQLREIQGVAQGDFPTLGPANAPVTLTVFSDFQCPYCARFADLMRKEVLPAEGDKIRLIFRYFPLSMHSWARASAEAAACAYQQKNDYFWSFHDFFFAHQRELTAANLRQQIIDHARSLAGLDQAKFLRCVEQESTKAVIDREVTFAAAKAIDATPTVFLNGKQTEIVAREQVLTILRELTPRAAPARAVSPPSGAPQ